jgi:hypothetical protein
MCGKMFVRQWMNTHASLFDLRPQSIERWIYWHVTEVQQGVRLCERQLSSTSPLESNCQNRLSHRPLGEHFYVGLGAAC